MKNILKGFLALAAAAALLTGCTKGYEELNKNRYGVSEDDLAQDGLAVGGMLQQLERSVIIYRDGTYLDSDYQIMYNLCGETWCGYMAPHPQRRPQRRLGCERRLAPPHVHREIRVWHGGLQGLRGQGDGTRARE